MSRYHIIVNGTGLTSTPKDKVIEYMMYKTAREVPVVPSIRASSPLLSEPNHWYSWDNGSWLSVNEQAVLTKTTWQAVKRKGKEGVGLDEIGPSTAFAWTDQQ